MLLDRIPQCGSCNFSNKMGCDHDMWLSDHRSKTGRIFILKPSAGAVFVYCDMGKLRSVTAVLAFLLCEYPHRYGLTPSMLDPH